MKVEASGRGRAAAGTCVEVWRPDTDGRIRTIEPHENRLPGRLGAEQAPLRPVAVL